MLQGQNNTTSVQFTNDMVSFEYAVKLQTEAGDLLDTLERLADQGNTKAESLLQVALDRRIRRGAISNAIAAAVWLDQVESITLEVAA